MPFLESLNGQRKTVLAAIAGGLIAAIPTAVVVGEYKGKVNVIDKSLTYHLESYTPAITGEFRMVQMNEIADRERIVALEKSLTKIENQNETIIRLLQRR